jgi:hypothetical protein
VITDEAPNVKKDDAIMCVLVRTITALKRK